VSDAEPGVRVVRAAGRETEPDPLRRMRLQVLGKVKGGGRLPKGQARRRSLLEVETHAVLLRQAADKDRGRSLGLQAVQARARELRVLPDLSDAGF